MWAGPVGPVRSPRGRVDVEVTPHELVLRRRRSWTDHLDSDLVVGGLALVGILLALGGLAIEGPAGVAVSVLGVSLVLPLLLLWLVVVVGTVWLVGRTVVLLLTGQGRQRLAGDVRRARRRVRRGGDGSRRVPRSRVRFPGPVEEGWRARLRVPTADGEIVLSVPRRHRARLEALSTALRPPPP